METSVQGLNALSSIVCFLTSRERCSPAPRLPSSQCPLEHCMLSDLLNEVEYVACLRESLV